MCISSQNTYTSMHNKQSRRCKIQLDRLTRRKIRFQEEIRKDMVMKNLKLYIENITILEENEKLRKKASLLHQENLELMSEFQKKFADPSDRVSTTLNLLLHKKENQ